MELFDKKIHAGKKIVFAIGTGRCGTMFLQRLLSKETIVASHHERAPLSDAFHRYCKWYGIPVDSAGFLHHKAKEISEDLRVHAVSFEASSYLSLSIEELYSCFDASFILLVRDPLNTTESYYRKGYYSAPYIRNNPSLPPTYQESRHFHHFLGRIVPSGSEYMSWLEMSRIVKIGWFWNAVNDMIVQQFSRIPAEKTMVVCLEDFDYRKYRQICAWIGFEPEVGEREFLRLAEKRPNSNKDGNRQEIKWTDKDYLDFARVVAPMSEKLEYSFSVDELKRRKSAQSPSTQTLKKWSWLGRNYLRIALKKVKKRLK